MSMKDNQQTNDEQVCARIFLEWLGGQHGIEWGFKRAEDEFPEFANKTRWEFVARRIDSISMWIAIEVKRLVDSEGERQRSDWYKLIGDVNTKVPGKLPGKFLLANPPKYHFNQQQRQVLVDCMAEVIKQVAPELEIGLWIDIGPEIANLFDAWPEDRRKQPIGVNLHSLRAVFPPHPLLILEQC